MESVTLVTRHLQTIDQLCLVTALQSALSFFQYSHYKLRIRLAEHFALGLNPLREYPLQLPVLFLGLPVSLLPAVDSNLHRHERWLTASQKCRTKSPRRCGFLLLVVAWVF